MTTESGDDASDSVIVGPSGRTYRLAREDAPPLERAMANRQVTRAYLADVIQTVQTAYPPEIAPMELVVALGQALRALPPSWLREYAYAGMLAVLQALEDERVADAREASG